MAIISKPLVSNQLQKRSLILPGDERIAILPLEDPKATADATRPRYWYQN